MKLSALVFTPPRLPLGLSIIIVNWDVKRHSDAAIARELSGRPTFPQTINHRFFRWTCRKRFWAVRAPPFVGGASKHQPPTTGRGLDALLFDKSKGKKHGMKAGGPSVVSCGGKRCVMLVQ